ncbi:hypothetical protein NDS46_26085 [Paenibacillus thiaminolyticus]|uniref:hypothetical protein n=1 Tax=Paenibacillus thiaminolyticus TaxID=49283 RepID=UPI00232C65A6|nr:hypothetical protein [Paenibacillus thiaminolyticus]WCF07730.1 hypothetical protein NDS46_26085 [Paenibacillus thiaminolyticus]
MSLSVKGYSDSGYVIKVFPDEYYSCKNITPSALTSLTLALKGFFNTYNTLHSFNYNLNNFTEAKEKQLCEYSEYHENYLQTIIHFHHFIELLMKDALRFHSENLANKLQNVKETELLQYLREGKNIDPIKFTEWTVEYKASVNRIFALPRSSFKDIIIKHKIAIEEINILRNKLLHRGALFLPYRKLDEFIVRMILPLVQDLLYKCEELWDGEELVEYWRYDNDYTDIDPIEEMISISEEKILDHKAIAFYKAVGFALYQKPVGNLLKRIYEEDLMRQIYDIQNRSKKTCFVCSYDTLFLYPDIDYSSPHELIKGEHCFKTGKAICTKCGFRLYNDVSEPVDYGINEEEGRIWEYTHLIEVY